MSPLIPSAAVGYFLGSIPFGYILVRTFRGTDVRTTGSGNIGATNVARTSPALGGLTLILDLLKGAAAVWIATALFPNNAVAGFVAALAAVCGHVFPVWLRFRGGKGVATGLGAFLLLTPRAILIALGVFVLVLLISHFVSLSSISAAVTVPIFAALLRETSGTAQLVSLIASCAILVAKHHKNLGRLMAGTEPKFRIKRA